jgi:hypothetical protein
VCGASALVVVVSLFPACVRARAAVRAERGTHRAYRSGTETERKEGEIIDRKTFSLGLGRG